MQTRISSIDGKEYNYNNSDSKLGWRIDEQSESAHDASTCFDFYLTDGCSVLRAEAIAEVDAMDIVHSEEELWGWWDEWVWSISKGIEGYSKIA